MLNKIITDYHNEVLAISSIGLDGEKIDNVTFKEKPRITVNEHMIVATAISCLDTSTIEYVLFEKTGINTPLGEIVIVEVTKKGEVLVAGPSTNSDMAKIIKRFRKYHPVKVLIDGALFRKSIASTRLVDGVILVTGASYNKDMEIVVNDTKSLLDQLMLNEVNNPSIKQYGIVENYFLDKEKKVIIKGSIIANESILKSGLLQYKTLVLKGALTNRIVDLLVEHHNDLTLIEIVVRDGSHILLNDANFQNLKKMGVSLKAYSQIDVLFVAYNPTSPYHYEFDNEEFKNELQTKLSQEVINVCIDLE